MQPSVAPHFPGTRRDPHERGRDLRSGQPRGATRQTHVGPTSQSSAGRAGIPNSPRPAGAASPRGPGWRSGSVPTWAAATGWTITSSTPYVAASTSSWARARVGVADDPAGAHRVDQRAVRVGHARRFSASSTRSCGPSGAPVRSATIISRLGSARRSASSADSATTALTVRKVRGSASSGDGRNAGAVELERLGGAGAGEVVGEDVGHPLLGGQPGRVVRGAEQPDGRDRAGDRRRLQRVGAARHAQPDAGRLHHRQDVVDVLREPGDGLVGDSAGAVAQRERRDRVGAGRPADARGRSGPGRRPRAARTARRPPAGRGWAASRRRSRPGSARWPRRRGRSSTGGLVAATAGMLWCSASQ